jgi:peptide/nickel transport system permease protein
MTEPLAETHSRRHRRPTLRMIAPAIVLFWVAMAFVGPVIAPYDVGEILDAGIFDGMGRANWLGTDYFGRDMLSRILAGARYTVGIALAAAGIAVVTGSLLGLAAMALLLLIRTRSRPDTSR